MRPILVLFDIDGTLLRGAGPHHKEALTEGVRAVIGKTPSFAGIDTAGRLDMDLIALLLESVAVQPEPALLAEIAGQTQQIYLATCSHDMQRFVCRGARELLEALSTRTVALALVTGNLTAIGWRKMELAGLKPFFHCGAFSEEAPTRAAIAKLAIERARAGHHAAHNCRVSHIGDHRNDIEAAKANGIRSVAVASGVTSAADLQSFSPDIFVHSLADLDIQCLLD